MPALPADPSSAWASPRCRRWRGRLKRPSSSGESATPPMPIASEPQRSPSGAMRATRPALRSHRINRFLSLRSIIAVSLVTFSDCCRAAHAYRALKTRGRNCAASIVAEADPRRRSRVSGCATRSSKRCRRFSGFKSCQVRLRARTRSTLALAPGEGCPHATRHAVALVVEMIMAIRRRRFAALAGSVVRPSLRRLWIFSSQCGGNNAAPMACERRILRECGAPTASAQAVGLRLPCFALFSTDAAIPPPLSSSARHHHTGSLSSLLSLETIGGYSRAIAANAPHCGPRRPSVFRGSLPK